MSTLFEKIFGRKSAVSSEEEEGELFTSKICYLYELNQGKVILIAKGTTNQIAGYLGRSPGTVRAAISRKEILDRKYTIRRKNI